MLPTRSAGPACDVMAMLEMGALPIMDDGRLATIMGTRPIGT